MLIPKTTIGYNFLAKMQLEIFVRVKNYFGKCLGDIGFPIFWGDVTKSAGKKEKRMRETNWDFLAPLTSLPWPEVSITIDKTLKLWDF